MDKKKLMIPVIFIFIVAIVMLTTFISYAVFNYYRQGTTANKITAGYLDIEIDESNTISINNKNAVPVNDNVGKNYTPYRFTLTNTGTGAVDYKINVIDDLDAITSDGCGSNLLDHSNIKAQLLKDGVEIAFDFLSNLESGFYSDTMNVDESSTFELRIWIDIDADESIMGKHFHGKLSVSMNQHITSAQ